MGRVVNAARFLEQAKAAGFWVYGAAMEGESLWKVDISGDAVLCLGSEGTGLRRLTRETCDRLVSIPMSPAPAPSTCRSRRGSSSTNGCGGRPAWEPRHENGLTGSKSGWYNP